MLVNIHLFCYIYNLLGQVFVIIKNIFILGIEFKTLVLEIVSFLDHSLQLLSDGIVYKFIFDIFFELMEQARQFIDFDFICLDELLLMLENGLLKCLAHQ